MLTLLYRSEATRPIPVSELAELCLVSARKNRELGITGFLVHFDGVFLQVLEGEAEVVEPLFHRISTDDRHGNVQVLMRETAQGRSNFAFWSMNLGPLDDPEFRRRVMQGTLDREAFAARSRDPEFALDVLTRAYMEACFMADVDPTAHDLISGTVPAWIISAGDACRTG